MSRTALLDGTLAFFLLAAFALPARRPRPHLRQGPADGRPGPLRRRGCSSAWRPWRIAAGLCFGLAVGTKWSALPFIALFGLMAVLWDASARRAVGEPKPLRSMLRRDAFPAFGSLVGLAGVVYLISWTGWLVHRRRLVAAVGAATAAPRFPFIPDRAALAVALPLRDGVLPHASDGGSPLPVQPVRAGPCWPARSPTGPQDDDQGEHGCEAKRCVREVLGHRHAGALVGRHRRAGLAALALGRRPRLAGRARCSPASRPAGCPGSATATGRSSTSTRSRSCPS